MKVIYLIAVLALLLASCSAPEYGVEDIPGSRWSQEGVFNGKPYEFVLIFREDYSYEGILNGKVFVSGGTYELSSDTIFFRDPVCNMDNQGSYTLSFKGDSLTFHLIADTCTARREGTDNQGFKRVE